MKITLPENKRSVGPRRLFGAFWLACVFVALLSSYAQSRSLPINTAGVRLGVWANTGDKGPLDLGSGIKQDVSSASLYAELFYNHGFNDWLRIEFAGGATSRTELVTGNNAILSGVNIYPIQLCLKFYPFGPLSLGPLHPFATGGGGLTIASQSAQRFDTFDYASRTKVDFNLVVGGGIDIPVASQIMLNVSVKYHSIDFSDDGFNDLTDFSGMSTVLGFAYSLSSGDDEESRKTGRAY